MSLTGNRPARDPPVTCEEGHSLSLRSVFAATPRKCRSGGRQCVNRVEKDALATCVTTGEVPGGPGLVNRERPSRVAQPTPDGLPNFFYLPLIGGFFGFLKIACNCATVRSRAYVEAYSGRD